jgi:hypothetical protein
MTAKPHKPILDFCPSALQTTTGDLFVDCDRLIAEEDIF